MWVIPLVFFVGICYNMTYIKDRAGNDPNVTAFTAAGSGLFYKKFLTAQKTEELHMNNELVIILDFGGQFCLGALDCVLQVDQRHVRVSTRLECDEIKQLLSNSEKHIMLEMRDDYENVWTCHHVYIKIVIPV